MYSWFGDSSGSGKRCQLIHGGQANRKGCALSTCVVRAKNLAAVFFHNSVTDTETEPGPFADLLGAKKRIEDAVGMADAVAVIAECHFDVVVIAASGNIDTRAGDGFAH